MDYEKILREFAEDQRVLQDGGTRNDKIYINTSKESMSKLLENFKALLYIEDLQHKYKEFIAHKLLFDYISKKENMNEGHKAGWLEKTYKNMNSLYNTLSKAIKPLLAKKKSLPNYKRYNKIGPNYKILEKEAEIEATQLRQKFDEDLKKEQEREKAAEQEREEAARQAQAQRAEQVRRKQEETKAKAAEQVRREETEAKAAEQVRRARAGETKEILKLLKETFNGTDKILLEKFEAIVQNMKKTCDEDLKKLISEYEDKLHDINEENLEFVGKLEDKFRQEATDAINKADQAHKKAEKAHELAVEAGNLSKGLEREKQALELEKKELEQVLAQAQAQAQQAITAYELASRSKTQAEGLAEGLEIKKQELEQELEQVREQARAQQEQEAREKAQEQSQGLEQELEQELAQAQEKAQGLEQELAQAQQAKEKAQGLAQELAQAREREKEKDKEKELELAQAKEKELKNSKIILELQTERENQIQRFEELEKSYKKELQELQELQALSNNTNTSAQSTKLAEAKKEIYSNDNESKIINLQKDLELCRIKTEECNKSLSTCTSNEYEYIKNKKSFEKALKEKEQKLKELNKTILELNSKQPSQKINFSKPRTYFGARPTNLFRPNKFAQVPMFFKDEIVWCFDGYQLTDYGKVIGEIECYSNGSRCYSVRVRDGSTLDVSDNYLVHSYELFAFS